MLLNASLRGVSYEIIVHKIRVDRIFKNIKKDNAKTFIKFNACIYLEITIDKIKLLTKNTFTKRYTLLLICVASAKIANKLIDKK